MDAALPRITILKSLDAVDPAAWNAVANPPGLPYDPFLSWQFLEAMESSGAATPHVDCDAFYASVEKRDDPALREKPLIVGGGTRGVVTTCCYIARLYGVRSAMPMFKALKLCPEAVVVPPDFTKYREAGRAIRARRLLAHLLVRFRDREDDARSNDQQACRGAISSFWCDPVEQRAEDRAGNRGNLP